VGDGMKESAQAAWSLLRARAGALGIPLDAFTQTDLHLHVPAGAVPKDGPSAGITMATALASLLCQRPARHDVAMTGELTLRGRVLPIGGLKEKLTAAARAGVKTVVVPARNQSDIVEVPDEVKKLLEIKPVDTLDEVLELGQFRLPAPTVVGHWGITSTEDFGHIVFSLIEVGLLARQPSDKVEDFDRVYDFSAVFRAGYRWPGLERG